MQEILITFICCLIGGALLIGTLELISRFIDNKRFKKIEKEWLLKEHQLRFNGPTEKDYEALNSKVWDQINDSVQHQLKQK